MWVNLCSYLCRQKCFLSWKLQLLEILTNSHSQLPLCSFSWWRNLCQFMSWKIALYLFCVFFPRVSPLDSNHEAIAHTEFLFLITDSLFSLWDSLNTKLYHHRPQRNLVIMLPWCRLAYKSFHNDEYSWSWALMRNAVCHFSSKRLLYF